MKNFIFILFTFILTFLYFLVKRSKKNMRNIFLFFILNFSFLFSMEQPENIDLKFNDDKKKIYSDINLNDKESENKEDVPFVEKIKKYTEKLKILNKKVEEEKALFEKYLVYVKEQFKKTLETKEQKETELIELQKTLDEKNKNIEDLNLKISELNIKVHGSDNISQSKIVKDTLKKYEETLNKYKKEVQEVIEKSISLDNEIRNNEKLSDEKDIEIKKLEKQKNERNSKIEKLKKELNNLEEELELKVEFFREQNKSGGSNENSINEINQESIQKIESKIEKVESLLKLQKETYSQKEIEINNLKQKKEELGKRIEEINKSKLDREIQELTAQIKKDHDEKIYKLIESQESEIKEQQDKIGKIIEKNLENLNNNKIDSNFLNSFQNEN